MNNVDILNDNMSEVKLPNNEFGVTEIKNPEISERAQKIIEELKNGVER